MNIGQTLKVLQIVIRRILNWRICQFFLFFFFFFEMKLQTNNTDTDLLLQQSRQD